MLHSGFKTEIKCYFFITQQGTELPALLTGHTSYSLDLNFVYFGKFVTLQFPAKYGALFSCKTIAAMGINSR